ncbi:PQQ-dependent sugar dehydrogenase [Ursidibacter maritimus]|uniref:PQQ-dependent sugar dehydrogenase n=1 Tax=Ursidibacter maritimus TaxID=1331689 RepID=A0A949T6N0_9PAST|nr:glucose/sorbosone family PQQ-dependent dehydrogenase [Ursidibacter maritimus]KAE9541530.1 dehydrogenase [Ursidibacter maritimus]MBV6524393.1 PQQ-dependent sugar dehydrogenase [Ursidibacter maritimus]MBV6526073.1 PQQ-dependent sugar dehydrogenase [Ursidibacter maritimus]MBV6528374.1 PQQ-dependent sugar dehydrogenase [Ursidibacter maritimus]MBV6529586.1 PQQ-dependent sugar dehydrogenase [Ursidibacter maritimus]
MKKILLTALLAAVAVPAHSAVENPNVITEDTAFKSSVLIDNLKSPWEMLWGADGNIWLTERQGKQISIVNPTSGEYKTLYTFENAFAAPPHQGLLGMALHPNFLKGKNEDYVYAYYTYTNAEKGATSEFGKIVRLTYDTQAQSLSDETIILDHLPAGDDHNAGRLVFGKDGKLYLSLGDNGYNQYANSCKEIRSQDIPSVEQIVQGDFDAYRGKILRINTDGSIPEDNPRIKEIKSHIYAYGFRNPQGLVFVNDKLFNVDQGPGTDDEVNLVEAGSNYGWPHIVGYQDNQAYQYINYSKVENCEKVPQYDGAVVPKDVQVVAQKETDVELNQFKAPLKTFFTVPTDYNFNDAKCNGEYICWPTVATTSIAYYPKDGKIKSFQNALLVTGVKTGTLYRLPLNADAKQVQGEVITHFRTNNRYRMVLVSPDTSKIYIATDSAGYIMGKDSQPTKEMANKGAILVFEAK